MMHVSIQFACYMTLPVFPRELAGIVAEYIPGCQFLDWIAPHVSEYTDFSGPAWFGLTCNSNAINILCANMHMFAFTNLSDNANACELLMERPLQVDWFYASQFPGAATWLAEHREFIVWEGLVENPSEIARDLLIERGIDLADWGGLCANPADWAMDIVLKHPDKFNYWGLSKNTNPRAIAVLEKNLDQVFYANANSNPAAFDLIMDRKIEEQFDDLMANPAAIDYIRDHISEDNYTSYNLWSNPAIFQPVLLSGLVELLSGQSVSMAA